MAGRHKIFLGMAAGVGKNSNHTALSDVHDSIAELRHYRQFMGALSALPVIRDWIATEHLSPTRQSAISVLFSIASFAGVFNEVGWLGAGVEPPGQGWSFSAERTRSVPWTGWPGSGKGWWPTRMARPGFEKRSTIGLLSIC